MEEILKYGQETNLYKVRQGSQCDFKDCRACHTFCSGQTVTDEYNAQPLEVDANAFAAVVMAEFFGISPQFLNMPESIRQLIYVRKRQIQKELKDG